MMSRHGKIHMKQTKHRDMKNPKFLLAPPMLLITSNTQFDIIKGLISSSMTNLSY